MSGTKKPVVKSGPNLVKQSAKFGLVGISNTLIDYTLYLAVTKLLNVPLDRVFMVKFFSGSVAMINSFYWNRRWVFRSKAGIGKSGVRFLTATLVSIWAIQPGLVFVFSATAAGLTFSSFWFDAARALGLVGLVPGVLTREFVIKTVAFGMGVVGSAIWNFTLYKLWAFRED
ncbi:MAG TPA: GtrA family protein [Candidatus Saccharimonadia bacterium]|nr:GtrA family protein [Candidatus Saccharimonadia bacterium]